MSICAIPISPPGDPTKRAHAYHRIAGALDWLAAHAERRPSPESAARPSAMSPFHFERNFNRLAGVSPLGTGTANAVRGRHAHPASAHIQP